MTDSTGVTSLVALTARLDSLDAAVAALGIQNDALMTAMVALTAAAGPVKTEFVAKRR
jgi:hypothetical protein